METAISIFVLVGVILLAAVLFVGWVCFAILRAIVRTLSAFAKPKPRTPPMLPGPVLAPMLPGLPQLRYFPRRQQQAMAGRCPRDNCRAENPMDAQFCRRCGMNLVAEKVYGPPKRGRVLAGA
jgi:ribosomal protein L40E